MAKQKSKFMLWYESYKGKKIVGMVYCIGASVVIIGALFKIMHFPGAGPVLMAGMITEAFLFMIGCFDEPHPEYHWDEVFPQLVGYGTEPEHLAEVQARPRPTLLGAGMAEGVAPAPEAKKVNVPALTDKDMEALKAGINDLAKTATQLKDLGTVATATTKLNEKMEAAGEAAEKFVGSQTALYQASANLDKAYQTVATEMKGVVAGTQNLNKGVEATNTNLGAINAVYELQLKAIQAQADAYNAQTTQVNAITKQVEGVNAEVAKIQTAVAEAAKNQAAYQASAKKLADQVADLNKIYGNMLTALAD